MSEHANDLLESLPAGRTNRKILDSWLRARGNKILPKRSAFENALPPNLALNAAIVEVQAPDKLIYTRRSAAVMKISGITETGINMLDITPPPYRAKRSENYWTVASRPCVAMNRMDYPLADHENGYVTVINLSLPVFPDNEQDPMEIHITAEVTDEVHSNLYFASLYRDKETGKIIPITTPFEFFDIGNGTEPVGIPNIRGDEVWPAISLQFEV